MTVRNAMLELTSKGKPTSAIVIGKGKEDEIAAQLLAEHVADISGVEIPIVGINESSEIGNPIHLGTLSEESSGMSILRDRHSIVSWEDRKNEANKRLNIPSDLGTEGFVFQMEHLDDRDHLVLGGHTPQGTLYSAVTAAERLCLDGNKTVIKYIDTALQPRINLPMFDFRSVATNFGGPDGLRPKQWEKEWMRPDGSPDWQGFVDFLVSHKLNNLNCWTFNLASGIAYSSARFPEMVNQHHPNVRQEFMQNLIEYAVQRNIETWFMLDFPDHFTGVIKERPHFAGKNIDLRQFPKGEAWNSYQKGDGHAGEVRGAGGWVCGAEPEVKRFWQAYLDELLDRYPGVGGIGGQFGEHSSQRCDCPVCSERYFDIQREFFEEMVEIARAKNPEITPWIYDSWGTPEIIKAAERFPGFVNIDWGDVRDVLKFSSCRQIPRSNWYLQHASASRWREFLLRHGTQVLATLGVAGYQIRGVFYRELDEMYHAVQEFTWNRSLNEDGFARLHIIRRYHRDSDELTKLYASWMKINRGKELLTDSVLAGWIDHEQERKILTAELATLESILQGIDKQDSFISDIAEAFQKSRQELHALAEAK